MSVNSFSLSKEATLNTSFPVDGAPTVKAPDSPLFPAATMTIEHEKKNGERLLDYVHFSFSLKISK